ncbi:MAG TPA: TonB family protein [Thermoanaerobaculia bacterium]|nr:TonB family protein [Thermoanaerobaculia bacterium]
MVALKLAPGLSLDWTRRRGDLAMVTVALGAILFGETLAGCRQGADSQLVTQSRPAVQAAARGEWGPWLMVDPRANSALEGAPIYHQGPAPPKLLHRAAVRITADPAALQWRNVIVEAVISPEGRIAKARVLRAPEIKGLQSAIIESLREWRFEPARLAASPVAVYYTLTLPLVQQGRPRNRSNPSS